MIYSHETYKRICPNLFLLRMRSSLDDLQGTCHVFQRHAVKDIPSGLFALFCTHLSTPSISQHHALKLAENTEL